MKIKFYTAIYTGPSKVRTCCSCGKKEIIYTGQAFLISDPDALSCELDYMCAECLEAASE